MKGVARMLLLLPMLLALGVALLRGGSLRALAALPLRGSGFFLAALAVQVALYLPPLRASALAAHGGALYAGSLVLALAGALRNAALGPAFWVATLGLALNTLVIVANGGHMPVNAAAMRAVRGAPTIHAITDARAFSNARLASPATRLTLLSDVIPVRLAGGLGNVYSVGDLLLAAGGAALVYQAAWRRAEAGAGDGLSPAR
jgi:hypothetical protein